MKQVLIVFTLLSQLFFTGFAYSAIANSMSRLQQHKWASGSRFCWFNSDPAIEVFKHSSDTYILRQNKCVHYEAPFIYVLFGETTVFIQDTGATEKSSELPLYSTIIGLVNTHAKQNNKKVADYQIVVSHSHSHSDHIAADSQFEGQPRVRLIKPNLTAVKSVFGFDQKMEWPEAQAEFDLGNRVLTIIPLPGHQSEALAVYDSKTQWLLTGDSLYPGRLYVKNWEVYRKSIARLTQFSLLNVIQAVMGTHIEMSKDAGVDYPMGSTFQPEEAPLPLYVDDLLALNKILQSNDTPKKIRTDKFIIFPIK